MTTMRELWALSKQKQWGVYLSCAVNSKIENYIVPHVYSTYTLQCKFDFEEMKRNEMEEEKKNEKLRNDEPSA